MINKTSEQIIAKAKERGELFGGNANGNQNYVVFTLDEFKAYTTALTAAPQPAKWVEAAISRCAMLQGIASDTVEQIRTELLAAYAAGAQSQRTAARNLRVPAFDEHPPQSQAVMPVEIAKAFHESYERLAQSFGYMTKEETRQFDETSPNGKLMIAVAAELQAAWPQSVQLVGPTVHIENCNFQGKNEDGSDVFIYRIRPDGSREIAGIRMISWNCHGPAPAQPTHPAAPANVDALDAARLNALLDAMLDNQDNGVVREFEKITAGKDNDPTKEQIIAAIDAAIAARGAT